jgi:hypothetical protein
VTLVAQGSKNGTEMGFFKWALGKMAEIGIVILSPTQLYRYTPEIFLFSTTTFKYKYRAPFRRIGQEYSVKVAFSIFQSMKRIQSLPVRSKLI